MITKKVHEKRADEQLIFCGLICFILEKKGFAFLDSIKVCKKKIVAIDARTFTRMGFKFVDGMWKDKNGQETCIELDVQSKHFNEGNPQVSSFNEVP